MLWKLAPMWWVLRSFGDALNELVEDNDALEMPNYAQLTYMLNTQWLNQKLWSLLVAWLITRH